eukprot:scaffold80_cov382-Prasinococcus_capsulatus_cf.AAC.11
MSFDFSASRCTTLPSLCCVGKLVAAPYRGPVSLEQVKSLWLEKQITRSTYLWLDGGPCSEWKQVDALPELLSFLEEKASLGAKQPSRSFTDYALSQDMLPPSSGTMLGSLRATSCRDAPGANSHAFAWLDPGPPTQPVSVAPCQVGAVGTSPMRTRAARRLQCMPNLICGSQVKATGLAPLNLSSRGWRHFKAPAT